MFRYCVAYSVHSQPSNHVLENFVRMSRTPKPQGRYTPPREHPVTLFNIPQRNINTTIKILGILAPACNRAFIAFRTNCPTNIPAM